MKKLLIALCLALAPSIASAKIGKRNLTSEYKKVETCFLYVAPTSASNQAAGVSGVAVYATGLNGGSVNVGGSAAASTAGPASMPYAAKLAVDVVDVNSNDAADSCSTVTIYGTNQLGRNIAETLTTVNTTEQVTTAVFASVTQVVATCSGYTDATDALWIAVDADAIGVPADIIDYQDVEICVEDADALTRCIPEDNGTANDLASMYDAATKVFDINASGALPGSATISAGDHVCMKARPRR